MAGIDKTYTDSFKEYSEFKEWSKGKIILFPSGLEFNLSGRYVGEEFIIVVK